VKLGNSAVTDEFDIDVTNGKGSRETSVGPDEAVPDRSDRGKRPKSAGPKRLAQRTAASKTTRTPSMATKVAGGMSMGSGTTAKTSPATAVGVAGLDSDIDTEIDSDIDTDAGYADTYVDPAITEVAGPDGADVGTELDGDGAGTARRSRLASLRRTTVTPVTTVAVGFVAVVLAVALALTMLALGNRNALDGARASALGAARTDAVELAGYNYRHLNQDFGAVLAHSTASFQRSFAQSSNALKSTLSRYHATAVAKVVSAGLVSATTSRAVVLVFLDQKITNSTQKNASTDRSQVEITLVKPGDSWLINQVTLL